MENNTLARVVILGACKTGKSSFISLISNSKVNGGRKMTMQLLDKEYERIIRDKNGRNFTFLFTENKRQYFINNFRLRDDATSVILFYDITNRRTFQNSIQL